MFNFNEYSLFQNRYFSSSVTNLTNSSIDPNYISGLTQSDGSFFVTIAKNSKSKFGLRIRPTFSITQDLDSLLVLEKIKNYFNCGYITINQKTYSAEFVVKSIPDLQNFIIPHFNKYPVFLSKQSSFLTMVLIIDILVNKDHYDKNVFGKMIKLIFSMNEVTNRTIDQERSLFEFIGIDYYDYQIEKPNIIDYPLNDQFLIGLIDGDGSFNISFKANKKIQFGFHITQDQASLNLLKKIQDLFNCGSINEKKTANYIRYQIDNINLIYTVLIPFIDKYIFHTNKAIHYNIFKEVCHLIYNNSNPSNNDLLKIIDLAYNMNKDGKRRKMTKEEYIAKYFVN